MRKTIISDAGCFITLSNINEFDLLHKVYGEVFTTPEVAEEFGEILPVWVIIKSASDQSKQSMLELEVDKGEASAICLALEIKESTLILYDIKARHLAEKLGLAITGTLGIIIKAKLDGPITSIKPILEKIKQTNFRLNDELEKQAIKEAGE
jgi:predicted nucleic acid-binding protein